MPDWRDRDPRYVKVEDDNEEDRLYWCLEKCILPEECSHLAWGKVTKTSYISLEDLVESLKYHLVVSGLHRKTKEEADALLAEHLTEDLVSEHVETRSDRDAYREWADRWEQTAHDEREAKRRKLERGPARGGGGKGKGGGGGGKGSGGGGGGKSSGQILPMAMFEPPPVPSQVARRTAENPDVMTLSFRQAQLLSDSLRRAREATDNSVRLSNAISAQLTQESQVIDAAYRIVEELVRDTR
jgi:hypothetical protein